MPRLAAQLILAFMSALFKATEIRGAILAGCFGFIFVSALFAQTLAVGPYKPEVQVSGVIRVWGSTEMSGVLAKWEQGFRLYQPKISFDDHLYGTASSIAGLYTGVGDISLLGRDIWPIESSAFQSVFHYSSTGIQVATGSYDIPKAAYALVVYVNKANPLSRITLEQLAGIFGVPNSDDARSTRSWGDLGLSGSWSSSPIHLYNFDYDNDKSMFFRRMVFAGRYHWRDRTKEFMNRVNADGSITDSGQLILDALANDRLGIAISNPHYANSKVKPVALAAHGTNYVAADKDSVAGRTYPLIRPVWIHINRPPQGRVDPKIAEFLLYVLSFEGQNMIMQDGTYLPLPARIVKEQIASLVRP